MMASVEARRHVRLFKPQFAPAVLAGTKCCTIRAKSKISIQPGDTLDLRQWSARPYASKQIKLREALCTRVRDLNIIDETLVALRERGLSQPQILLPEQVALLAECDGFESVAAFFDFFRSRFPFYGELIEWNAGVRAQL